MPASTALLLGVLAALALLVAALVVVRYRARRAEDARPEPRREALDAAERRALDVRPSDAGAALAALALARIEEIAALSRAGLGVHAGAAVALAAMGENRSATLELERVAAHARALHERAQRLVAARFAARPERDRFAEDRRVDAWAALNQAVAMLQPRLERVGLDISARVRTIHDPLPPCVGDIRALHWLFALLIDAAASAPGHGGVDGRRPGYEFRCQILPGELAVEVRMVARDAPTRLAMARADALLCRHLATRVGGVIDGLDIDEPTGAGAQLEPDTAVRVLLPIAQ